MQRQCLVITVWTGNTIVFVYIPKRIMLSCQSNSDMYLYSHGCSHAVLTLCGMGQLHKCSHESMSITMRTRVHESQCLNAVCHSSVLGTGITGGKSDSIFNNTSAWNLFRNDHMEPINIS